MAPNNPNLNPDQLRDVIGLASALKEAFIEVGETIVDAVNGNINDTDTLLNSIQKKISREIKKSFQDLSKGTDSIIKNNVLLNQGLLKQATVRKQMVDAAARLASVEAAVDIAVRNGLVSEQEREDVVNKTTESIQEQLDELQKQSKEIDEQNKKLGSTGRLLKGISKIPVLGDFIDAEEALVEAQREAAKANSSSTSVMVKSFKSLGKSLASNLVDPLTIVTGIFEAIINLDKQIGEIAKNFGISYNSAAKLSDSLNETANSAFSLFATTENLTESFLDLNKRFGTFADLNRENLKFYNDITKEAKVSGEAIGSIYDTTFLTNKSLEDSTAEYLGQVKILKAQTGLAINEREVLEDIQNVSSATKIQLGGSAKAIAEAVFKAKALGMELRDLESISESLLNFQSSIESELAAELLTGKQLNLEGARYAALVGDQAMLADELAKNIGTAADFNRMNVLQQKALAESVGLTRDSLADSLLQREALNKLSQFEGKTAQERYRNAVKQLGIEGARKKLGNDSLADQMQSASMQERFTAAVEKLKDVFVTVAEAFMPFLDLLTEALNIINPIVKGIGFLVDLARQLGSSFGGITGTLIGLTPILLRLSFIMRVMSRYGFLGAIAAIYQSFAQIPFGIGIPLSIAAVAGLSSLFKKGDDVMSPGYGKRIMFSPEGAIAFNDKDNIIATTNPIRNTPATSKTTSAPAATNQNLNNNINLSVDLDGRRMNNINVRTSNKIGINSKVFGRGIDASA